MEKSIEIKPTLFLFTNEFPYGGSETYLESEIPVYQKFFSKIYFLPFNHKGDSRITNSINFSIKSFEQNWASKRYKILIENFFLVFRILYKEFLFVPDKLAFVKKINLYKNMLIHKLYVADQLGRSLDQQHGKVVLCSYWFSDWATILCLLKLKRNDILFVSRGHGYDIYDDRFDDNYIPFRYLHLSTVDAVYSVSKKGAEYLKQKNIYPEKIKVSYLGVSDLGVNPFDPDNEFTIVSCSNVNVFKRVDLIVDILMNINFPVKWVHFGDGDQLELIKEKAKGLPKQIKADFRGRVTNAEIMNFYLKHSVNLFITTSAMEGLPMTLIEAASFGIPLMGTNVGGIPEIINTQTGILIQQNVDVKLAASEISLFRYGNRNTYQFRDGVRSFWQNNFNSNKNYSKLYEEIIDEYGFII